MGHRRRDENASDSSTLSSGSSVVSDSSWEKKRRKRRRRDTSSDSDSDSEYSSSEDDSRKRRKKRRKHKHKREKKSDKSDKKRRREKHESRKLKKSRKHRQHHHHHQQSGDEQDEERDSNKAETQPKLQVTMEAREQEKLLIYQNANLAKARLNGELREVQAQQAKLQDMYGTIDWRARKKLRIEKKRLERSVAAGKKLAQKEEEETARMDAFRIALGLPTAEAQRQAEWRAEATRALAQEPHSALSTKPSKKAIIGPQLPR